METHNFSRIGDYSYSFQVKSSEGKTNVLIKSSLKEKAQKNHALINQISNNLLNNSSLLSKNKEIYFKYHDHIYKLIPSSSYKKSFFASLISFFKNTANLGVKEYELEEAHALKSFFLNKEEIYHLNQSAAPPAPKTLPLMRVNEEKFIASALKTDSFSDPYTQLSHLAFQKYEPFYDGHDPKKGENFDPRYILIETRSNPSELKLVKKEKHTNDENIAKTVINYRLFLVSMYGEDKVKYIEKCYGIDLINMIEKKMPLTPEIVYRMNIGIGNVEIQDIQSVQAKLKILKEEINKTPSEEQQTTSVLKFFERYSGAGESEPKFSLFEMKGIERALKQMVPDSGEPTLANLSDWLNQLGDLSVETEKLNGKQFNQLLSILTLTDQEKEAQYTGRKIHYPIQSAYTTADVEKFKPWIDQQELLQIFPNLQNGGWDNYYEKLCHIVCKKHLVRQHPTDVYRVGALIPAPNTSDGQPQWYQVTNFLNNGRGIVSYTLEPACRDSSLPAIKLYRSTASDPYAMDSEASVKNDINPLNPPGYEGSYLSEKYEGNFFQERTIPVWVAYQHQADLQIQEMTKNPQLMNKNNLSSVFENLKASTEELQKTRIKQEGYVDLSALIKKYDAEFIDLLKQAQKSTSMDASDLDHLNDIIMTWKDEVKNLDPAHLKKQKNDAKFIQKMFGKMPHTRENALIISLLDREIIRPFRKSDEFEEALEMGEMDSLSEGEIAPLSVKQLIKYELEYERLLVHSQKNPEQTLQLLQNWNLALSNHAKALNEDIASKKPQEIVLAGHSLGGACAQRGCVQFLIDKGRIPLPNQKTSLRLFDEPGIRFSDNEAFKDFGNRHANLLKKQQSQFSITRRHEEGDFVVTGGEVHLGATYDAEEEKKVGQWMHFDASVQSARPEARDFAIAHSPTAHATQFETGKRHSVWMADTVEEYLKGNQKNASEVEQIKKMQKKHLGDYTRTWYTSTTQGIFDLGPQSKHWEHIKDIWSINVLDSKIAENLRLKIGLMLRTDTSFSELLKASRTEKEELSSHGEWQKNRDPDGVFAVNVKGVISSSPDQSTS